MNPTLATRIRAHLTGEEVLTDEGWQAILQDIARALCDGSVEDADLVVALLDSGPERIDRHLAPAQADRVLGFLDGMSPPGEPPRRAEHRLELVRVAGETYPPRATAQQPTREKPIGDWLLAWLRPVALVAAGAVGGLVIGLSVWAPPEVELATLFPGYSPEYYPAPSTDVVPRALVRAPVRLKASVWFDRRDGAYEAGHTVTVAYQVAQRAHVRLVELSTEGRVQVWEIAPGGPVDPDTVHWYPRAPDRLVLEGPPGPEDVLLLATSVPLPAGELAWLSGARIGPAGGERTDLLDRIRDRVRTWAKGAGADAAFARAHAEVSRR